MRLLTKTALIYITVTLLLFLAGGAVFYFQMKSIVEEDVTENLLADKDKVQEYYKIHNSLPQNQLLFTGRIDTTSLSTTHDLIHDTVLYSQAEQEFQEFKVIAFPLKKGDSTLNIILSIPSFESDDIVEGIGLSLLIIAALLVIILLIVNGIFSFRMWKPFFHTIDAIKNYELNEHQSINLKKVKIKEFAILNEEIQKMTKKISKNFLQISAFTENASHEMQTPLSSILIDAELMMQKTNLPDDLMARVQNMYNTTLRLSKINETLLLLARIENDQFPKSNIDLTEIIKEKLNNQQEIILFKKIEVSIEAKEPLIIMMNQNLAEIFIGNLVSNAIRHNIENGQIQVHVDHKGFEIINTGKPLMVTTEELFERFKKNDQSSKSLGLGLAIVKQIADLYKIKLSYSYSERKHTVAMSL